MSQDVVTTCCLLTILVDMGDMQISWLNELCLQHVMNFHVSWCNKKHVTKYGDVFCCLFLLLVVTQQKSMFTWLQIHHVSNMSQNVSCHWSCCHLTCYSDTQQFQLGILILRSQQLFSIMNFFRIVCISLKSYIHVKMQKHKWIIASHTFEKILIVSKSQ